MGKNSSNDFNFKRHETKRRNICHWKKDDKEREFILGLSQIPLEIRKVHSGNVSQS